MPYLYLSSKNLNWFANIHKYKKNEVDYRGGLGEGREIKPGVRVSIQKYIYLRVLCVC